MDTLDGLKTIIALVETGSFTKAGERLSISKALVSKYVSQIERQLATRLFNRSTRKLALTQAGERYYQNALNVVDNYALLVDSVTEEEGSPQGTLCISTSVTFGDTLLSPILSSFLDQYPELKIALKLTDKKIDMLEEGVDVVIRIGSVDDSTLIAKKLNDFPLVLCASADFIQRHGQPETVTELSHYNCIIDSNFEIAHKWPFVDKSGNTEVVSVNSNVCVNSPRSVLELALSGMGIALLPQFIANQAIENRKLVPILTDYSLASFSLYIIYPHRRYVAKKVRCFIDFMRDEFSEELAFS